MRRFRQHPAPAVERPIAAILAALAVLAAVLLPLAHGLELRCMCRSTQVCHEHRHDAGAASHHHHHTRADHRQDSAPEPQQDDEHDPATCPTCAVILAINAATALAVDGSGIAWRDGAAGVACPRVMLDAGGIHLDGRLPARGPPAALA